MSANPSPELRVISAEEAARIGKQTARVYVPRIVHVDWETIHVLIGVAAHTAWKTLAKKYKMIRLRGKREEFHRLTGDLMRKWCWELVEAKL